MAAVGRQHGGCGVPVKGHQAARRCVWSIPAMVEVLGVPPLATICARVMRETPWCTFLGLLRSNKVAGTIAAEACVDAVKAGLSLLARAGDVSQACGVATVH